MKAMHTGFFTLVLCVAGVSQAMCDVNGAGHSAVVQPHYSRAGHLLQEQRAKRGAGDPLSPSSSAAQSSSATMVAPLGFIALSDKHATNQQLRQGMNVAQTGLAAMKKHPVQAASPQTRQQVAEALEQAVTAYLASMAEQGIVRPSAAYPRDPFLRDMVAVKEGLLQKNLSANDIEQLQNQLMAARTVLASLTDSRL